MNDQTYNVIVSSKVPVTLWYCGQGVVPTRQVVYRSPKVVTTSEVSQIGVIVYHKQRIPVIRRRNDPCSQYSAWEACRMIDPYARYMTDKESK